MLDVSTALLFCGAALLLLIVPGPAVLYIVARSASQGRRAGLVSVAGIHVGTLVHVAAAAAGLSALIVTSAAAFTAVKFAGAAYLVYIGINTIRQRRPLDVETADSAEPAARSSRRIFADGVVLNILNPKTAVFFLAFVPQFVDVDAGATTGQLIALGALFIALGLVTDGAYALAGGWIGDRVRRSPRATRRSETTAGAIYIGLGLTTALSGRPT